jgi:hypothetical protein
MQDALFQVARRPREAAEAARIPRAVHVLVHCTLYGDGYTPSPTMPQG